MIRRPAAPRLPVYDEIASSKAAPRVSIPPMSRLDVEESISCDPRDQPLSPIGRVVVRISNLKDTVTESCLRSRCVSFGDVQHITMKPSSAIVVFSMCNEAQRCYEQLNGVEWEGSTVKVDLISNRPMNQGPPSRPIARRTAGKRQAAQERRLQDAIRSYCVRNDMSTSLLLRARAPPGSHVFIGNLSWNASWQDVKDLCSKFGKVLNSNVELDERGRSRGFARVVFRSPKNAQDCIKGLNGKPYRGRPLSVKADRHAATVKAGAVLHVGNLAWTVGWQDLKDAFRPHGKVLSADVMMNSKGQSQGHGTVTFADSAMADAAMAALNGTAIRGRQIRITRHKQ